MAFHESFWVVAGTAASVIALAQIVALGDANRGYVEAFAILQRDRAGGDRRGEVAMHTGQAMIYQSWALPVGYVNMLLQVAILALALIALAGRRDMVPLVIVSIAAPLGLVLLTVCSALASAARYALMRIRPVSGKSG